MSDQLVKFNQLVPPVAIGPTFAGSNITITSTNTFFTAVTLVSALVNGGVYDLKGVVAIRPVGTVPTNTTVEIFDSTNSVVIWGGTITINTLNNFALFSTPSIRYNGFAGTPTIILRVMNDAGTANVILAGYLDTTGLLVTGKTTYIQAERVG